MVRSQEYARRSSYVLIASLAQTHGTTASAVKTCAYHNEGPYKAGSRSSMRCCRTTASTAVPRDAATRWKTSPASSVTYPAADPHHLPSRERPAGHPARIARR